MKKESKNTHSLDFIDDFLNLNNFKCTLVDEALRGYEKTGSPYRVLVKTNLSQIAVFTDKEKGKGEWSYYITGYGMFYKLLGYMLYYEMIPRDFELPE
jgi:hypothetical protein